MSFITEIFNRSSLNGLMDYLLYGDPFESKDKPEYEERLKKSRQRCKYVLTSYEDDEESILHDAVDDFFTETTEVYMEIGMKTGFLLAIDILNVRSDNHFLTQYKEMYKNIHNKNNATVCN